MGEGEERRGSYLLEAHLVMHGLSSAGIWMTLKLDLCTWFAVYYASAHKRISCVLAKHGLNYRCSFVAWRSLLRTTIPPFVPNLAEGLYHRAGIAVRRRTGETHEFIFGDQATRLCLPVSIDTFAFVRQGSTVILPCQLATRHHPICGIS